MHPTAGDTPHMYAQGVIVNLPKRYGYMYLLYCIVLYVLISYVSSVETTYALCITQKYLRTTYVWPTN